MHPHITQYKQPGTTRTSSSPATHPVSYASAVESVLTTASFAARSRKHSTEDRGRLWGGRASRGPRVQEGMGICCPCQTYRPSGLPIQNPYRGHSLREGQGRGRGVTIDPLPPLQRLVQSTPICRAQANVDAVNSRRILQLDPERNSCTIANLPHERSLSCRSSHSTT